MRTFAQKPKATQQATPAKSTIPSRAYLTQSCDVNSNLHLQRTIGNQAVQRLQTKLAINTLGDEYEQEADRVADRVMRMPDSQPQHVCPCGGGCPRCRRKLGEDGSLQAKHVESINAGETTLPIVHEVLRSSGQPLDSATRGFMELHFGHDFGNVQVHADTQAAKSAAAVNALAYTVGRDIVFSAGKYSPGTGSDRRLLAHELAHVVQQSGAEVRPGRAFAGVVLQRQTQRPATRLPYADIMPRPGEMARRERTRREVIPSLTELNRFRATVHEARGFRPSTGLGAFDVIYTPAAGRLDIIVEIRLTFVNQPLPNMQWTTPTGHPPPGWVEQATRMYSWSRTESEAWKRRFFQILNDNWNRSPVTFHCTRPYWERLSARVHIFFRERPNDGLLAQHNVDVYKVTAPRGTNASHGQGGELEARDLEPRPGTGQIPAMHEGGHWLGLDEEYLSSDRPDPSDPHGEERPAQRERLLRSGARHGALVQREFGHGVPIANDDRIMSTGMRILPEHSVTFLEGLRAATRMQEWFYDERRATPIPGQPEPLPHTETGG